MTVKKALLLARMDPPDTNEADWNNWYNHTHVANREKLPGFISSRRFEKIEGLPAAYHTPGQANYLALYDVSSIRILTGKAYTTVRVKEFATPPDSYENPEQNDHSHLGHWVFRNGNLFCESYRERGSCLDPAEWSFRKKNAGCRVAFRGRCGCP